MRLFKSSTSGSAEGGFILVAVLWILSALATLAAVYALYVNETAAAFVGHNDRVRAQEVAIAGIELAVYQMTANPGSRPSNGRLEFRLASTDVAVNFRSEGSRIDLNAAPKELLAGLFIALGAKREDADGFTDRIVAWRTLPTPGTTDSEALLYRGAGRIYGPRRGPFQHVNELALVLGLPEFLIDRALPYLTVYSGMAEVNVIDAAPEVLAALPGMTPDRLSSMLAQRSGAPADVLMGRLGSAVRYGTVQPGRASRITVDMRFDATRRARSEIVVLLLDGDVEPYRILSWRDEVDGPLDDERAASGSR